MFLLILGTYLFSVCLMVFTFLAFKGEIRVGDVLISIFASLLAPAMIFGCFIFLALGFLFDDLKMNTGFLNKKLF